MPFLAENVEKSLKIVIIESTPGRIDCLCVLGVKND
jgi:hypothetical protein